MTRHPMMPDLPDILFQEVDRNTYRSVCRRWELRRVGQPGADPEPACTTGRRRTGTGWELHDTSTPAAPPVRLDTGAVEIARIRARRHIAGVEAPR